MKILEAKQQRDKIFISAEVDGETRNYHFALDKTANDIKVELEKCEKTIKLEKEQWKANAVQDALDSKVTETITELLT